MLNRIRFIAAALASLAILASLVPNAQGAKNPSLENAREYAQQGDWETAIMHLQTAIGKDESNAAAWALWGDANLALGDTGDAIEHYEKAFSLDQKLPSPVLELTRFYLANNRDKDAERIVATAEKKDEKSKVDEIKVARGLIFAKQGNFPEATRILANAAAKNKKNPLYPTILARLYNNAGVKEQAVAYYADAWKLAPGDLTLAYEYALVLQDLQQYNEALDLFKVVQAKAPDNKTVDFMIGRLYFAAKRWGEAGAQFQKAVAKRPDHFMSYYLLGKSTFEYSKAEKVNFYRQSEHALRRALELKPDRADVISTLAEVLNVQARLMYQLALSDTVPALSAAYCDTSIQLYHETLKLAPTTKAVNGYLARVYLKLGNLDSTIYYSKLQLLETPDDPADFSRLVSTLQKKKDFPGLVEALKPMYEKHDWTFRRAEGDSAVYPQDKFLEKYAPIYASALMEAGETQKAREILVAMLAYAPKWKAGYGLNVYIDLKKSNYAGAIPVIRGALKELPNEADLWVQLGDCEYFANPKSREAVKRAREAYERAAALGSKDGKQKAEQLAGIR